MDEVDKTIKKLGLGCGNQVSVNMFRFDCCSKGNLCYSCKRAIELMKKELKLKQRKE